MLPVITIGFISSIIQNPIIVFDLITMEGLDANYLPNYSSIDEEFYKKPINIPFHINTFFIEGLLTSNINGHKNVLVIWLDLVSNIKIWAHF